MSYMVYRTASFSMTLNDPYPRFQGHAILRKIFSDEASHSLFATVELLVRRGINVSIMSSTDVADKTSFSPLSNSKAIKCLSVIVLRSFELIKATLVMRQNGSTVQCLSQF